MKTHNLTQDSDRNDPINRRIQGFSFRDFENDHRCSRGEFSLFDRGNLTFNHSVDAEMCLEVFENKIFKDWKQEFNCLKSSKNALQCRITSQFIVTLGVIVRWCVWSLINGSDEMHQCESLRLSHGCWIGDGPPRFHHIAREEETHETDDLTISMRFRHF